MELGARRRSEKEGRATSELQRRAVVATIIGALATLVIYEVGFLSATIGRPLLWLSTLVHELGHGLAALLLGGEFLGFVMFGDGSGMATHRSEGHLAVGLVAAGGLVGPALMAGLGFLAARHRRSARICLGVYAAVLALVLALFVGNLFAGLFVGGLVVVFAALTWFGSRSGAQLALVFLSMQLALSVFSRADYLFTAEAVTGAGTQPSDSAQMAMAFGGHYLLWGALCGLVSLAVLGVGASLLLRGAGARVRAGDRAR